MHTSIAIDGTEHLDKIALAINQEHEAAFGKARQALDHARRAGEFLLKAKRRLTHGSWLPWIRENCRFSVRMAQGYMRLAEGWPELEAKCATVAYLPLRDALALLAEPAAVSENLPIPPRGSPQVSEADPVVEVVERRDPVVEVVDAETARALECRRQLAALLAAWADASPDTREQFVALKAHEIRGVFGQRKAAV
jgi:hypothetical protein